MRNTKISLQRFLFATGFTVLCLIASFAICIINQILADKLICILVLTIIFCLCFFAYETRNRIAQMLPEKIYTSYFKLLITGFMAWGAFIAFMFVPKFMAPFIIIPVIMSGVCDTAGAMIFSVYLVSMFALVKETSVYNIVSMLLLAVIGSLLSVYLKAKAGIEKIFAIIIIFTVQILIPIIGYYLDELEMKRNFIVYAFVLAIISAIISSFVPLLFDVSIKKMDENVYEDLIVDNFPLVEDIRRYSFYEFAHARRVMRLSRICAQVVNANVGAAGCAGMYYRLGKILGEPEIDNAIKACNNHCFPTAVTDILYEYNGILKKPSTPESAIVQMVDAVVTKIELLDSDSMSSSWNQNMVIYQTINELSENGMYDECGLSMNNFLKVREALTKEDILA